MSLPIEWVEKIFAKLSVTYGRAFISQYEGIDAQAIKADWAHELAAYVTKPEAIKFALENLPVDKAPNVLQFRAMCRRCQDPVFKALPVPEPTPEQRAKVKEMIEGIRKKMTQKAGG